MGIVMASALLEDDTAIKEAVKREEIIICDSCHYSTEVYNFDGICDRCIKARQYWQPIPKVAPDAKTTWTVTI